MWHDGRVLCLKGLSEDRGGLISECQVLGIGVAWALEVRSSALAAVRMLFVTLLVSLASVGLKGGDRTLIFRFLH